MILTATKILFPLFKEYWKVTYLRTNISVTFTFKVKLDVNKYKFK